MTKKGPKAGQHGEKAKHFSEGQKLHHKQTDKTRQMQIGTKYRKNGKKTRVKGENDERISKSEVFVSNIFDLTQILFPGKIPTTGSDSLTSKKSCMPGLLFLIKIVRKKL